MRRTIPARRLLAGLAAAAVGVVAGCGSTGILGHGRTATTVTAVEDPGPATTTMIATGTTVPSTTTADLPGTGRPAILLGDMNTPEQFIIGELYQNALAAQGYSVDVSRNIGPTSVSEAALAQGSLDMYPEYLNIYDSQVAGDTQRFKTLDAAYAAGQRWASTHGQTLLVPTPFSNTAGVAVLSSYAHAHHLRSLADLRRVQKSLTLGSPLEYAADPDGLPALEAAYHFTPAVTAIINIPSQYTGLRIGNLQAAYVQTSDWQLSVRLYRDLPDTKHVLGFGNVVPVVSVKTLTAEGPVFAETINRVDALLSTGVIRGMAAEMEASSDPAQSSSDVAQEFLQGYGITPPPPWATLTTTTTVPTTTSATGASSPSPTG